MKVFVALFLTTILPSTDAFSASFTTSSRFSSKLNDSLLAPKGDFSKDIEKQTMGYQAGKADTNFARRFGDLSGRKVKTVSETMKEFTQIVGVTINPLYRAMVTDTISTTHLTVVDARFKYDKIWALGFISSMDILLKNYPEKPDAVKVVYGLAKSMGLDDASMRVDADSLSSWAQGKTAEDIAAALRGEGDSELAAISKEVKDEEFWLYSRFFGIGLMSLMDLTGVVPDAPTMNKWLKEDLGVQTNKGETDYNLWMGVRNKLSMMETLMKEVEIREKKKMAARLEDKAAAAIRRADAAAKDADAFGETSP